MAAMDRPVTFGVIVGTRGFFNPKLAADGGRSRYEAKVYDAWRCRKVFEGTWACCLAKGLDLPRYAAIVLRRKRGG